MDFLVGTFNTPHIFSLRFTPPHPSTPSTARPRGSLRVLARHPAIGSHSWLSLSQNKKHLYATAWTEPSSIAAYAVTVHPDHDPKLQLLNSVIVASRSGYVCASTTHVYSAGGASGEVFPVNLDGSLGECVQKLSFVEDEHKAASTGNEQVPHGDFGGLRHGAHSIDLSPDGKSLYVADIGRNCVWTFSIAHPGASSDASKHLTLASKSIAPRAHDGPRHTTPHPNGSVLYSLQEHSSMVDAFSVADDGVTLTHLHGVKILPAEKDHQDFWADEVRLSATEDGHAPKYLYASTRGLKAQTNGYVAVFRLDPQGVILGEALTIWETPTSGGWANAVEPAPTSALAPADCEWLALTDSEEGWVFILGFNGHCLWEAARCKLGDAGDPDDRAIARDGALIFGAATAVWL